MKQICNWCGKVGDETRAWTKARLSLVGCPDELPWLPSKELRFCKTEDCQAQVERIESYVLEGVRETWPAAACLVVEDADGVSFDENRHFPNPDGWRQLLELGRFFTQTSHPSVKAFIEGFEAMEERG